MANDQDGLEYDTVAFIGMLDPSSIALFFY